jgi:hypothetical protein
MMKLPAPSTAPDDAASLGEFERTSAERLAGLGYVVFCADSMCGDPSATEAYFAALAPLFFDPSPRELSQSAFASPMPSASHAAV